MASSEPTPAYRETLYVSGAGASAANGQYDITHTDSYGPGRIWQRPDGTARICYSATVPGWVVCTLPAYTTLYCAFGGGNADVADLTWSAVAGAAPAPTVSGQVPAKPVAPVDLVVTGAGTAGANGEYALQNPDDDPYAWWWQKGGYSIKPIAAEGSIWYLYDGTTQLYRSLYSYGGGMVWLGTWYTVMGAAPVPTVTTAAVDSGDDSGGDEPLPTIFRGGAAVGEIFRGSVPVVEVYRGDVKIWPPETEDPDTGGDYSKIVVSGAGTAAANGNYVSPTPVTSLSDFGQGVGRWVNGDVIIAVRSFGDGTGQWYIGDTVGFIYYLSYGNMTFIDGHPPLWPWECEWQTFMGSTPLPTVAEGGGTLPYYRHPNCICAIVPERGGAWMAPCRPDTVIPHEPADWPSEMYPNSTAEYGVRSYILTHPLDNYELDVVCLIQSDSRKNAYVSGTTGWGIHYNTAGALEGINHSVGVTGASASYAITPEIGREYHIVLNRINGVMQIFFDGALVRTATGTNTDWTSSNITMTRQSGILRSAKWTNLTRGEVVFNYPESLSVKQNMIFQYNQDTSKGYFESRGNLNALGDNTNGGFIATNLDLSGSTSNYTMVCECEIPNHPFSGAPRTWFLVGQGAINGNSASEFQMGIRIYQVNASTAAMWFRVSDGATIVNVPVAFLPYWGRRIVVVGVLDWTNNIAKLYIDGVQVLSGSLATLTQRRLNPSNNQTNAMKFFSSYNTGGAYSNTQKIYRIALFDCAMQENEIHDMQ